MKNKDFYKEMKLQEQKKRSAGDESTADLYRAAGNHFKRFNNGRELSLKDITPTMVYAFVEWLREKGLRTNSVNSYLSNLRAMYHRACRSWKGKPQDSPFAGLHLRQEETLKRAAPAKVIKQIASLDLKAEPKKQLAADLALFSFMACGMPFVDVVHLTRENLIENGKVLTYNRQKTGALIQIEVTVGMQFLIDRYSRPGERYLFPVLPENATHEQYKCCLARQNEFLEEIGKLLNWDGKLTTYVFRHSWASEAYHSHVPISIISQALGHTSEKMTHVYLQSFSAKEVGKAVKQVAEKVELLLKG
ncbi:tyrosine-type recombinase/integrase [Parabacteroides timonensis]|uniref:tyrosine-type recombinase/integrase n=1 Tax=Parabacteroides timonensis TaxID=1871013 RepID=UPI00094E8D98|nr:site-specific integrase [Parabacteroides timonensis]